MARVFLWPTRAALVRIDVLSVEGVLVSTNLDELLQFLFRERTSYLSSRLNRYSFHKGSTGERGNSTDFHQFGGIET
jgi:hypothetical protein